MTLDDIQDSIYEGDKGVEKALDIIEEYIERHKRDDVSPLYTKAKRKSQQIPGAFLNQFKVTKKYRDYYQEASSKSTNPVEIATNVVFIATQDANKRILQAKEDRTKRNREMEKNIVTKYLQLNHGSFVALSELRDIMNEIKEKINEPN